MPLYTILVYIQRVSHIIIILCTDASIISHYNIYHAKASHCTGRIMLWSIAYGHRRSRLGTRRRRGVYTAGWIKKDAISRVLLTFR